MKFRYLIVNTFNGRVEGTNDPDCAVELSECDEHFVIDAEKDEWIVNGEAEVIVEFGSDHDD